MTAPPDKSATDLALHHIALRSSDVEGLAQFYRELFGLKPAGGDPPRSLWLRLGAESVLMIERRDAGEPAPSPGSQELLAFAVTAERKDAIHALARKRGCTDGETSHTLYLRDPEGRRLGVSTYPLANGDRLTLQGD